MAMGTVCRGGEVVHTIGGGGVVHLQKVEEGRGLGSKKPKLSCCDLVSGCN